MAQPCSSKPILTLRSHIRRWEGALGAALLVQAAAGAIEAVALPLLTERYPYPMQPNQALGGRTWRSPARPGGCRCRRGDRPALFLSSGASSPAVRAPAWHAGPIMAVTHRFSWLKSRALLRVLPSSHLSRSKYLP